MFDFDPSRGCQHGWHYTCHWCWTKNRNQLLHVVKSTYFTQHRSLHRTTAAFGFPFFMFLWFRLFTTGGGGGGGRRGGGRRGGRGGGGRRRRRSGIRFKYYSPSTGIVKIFLVNFIIVVVTYQILGAIDSFNSIHDCTTVPNGVRFPMYVNCLSNNQLRLPWFFRSLFRHCCIQIHCTTGMGQRFPLIRDIGGIERDPIPFGLFWSFFTKQCKRSQRGWYISFTSIVLYSSIGTTRLEKRRRRNKEEEEKGGGRRTNNNKENQNRVSHTLRHDEPGPNKTPAWTYLKQC